MLACFLAVPHAITAVGQVQPDARMMRSPDVSAEKIVFSYGDDLWLVDRAGGVATPLASPPGAESNPRFSPNGQAIAFEGNYEGGRDLYVIPTAGGISERWTHHPSAERLCEWTPDGNSLLHSSNGFAGLARMNQLFTVSKQQPLPKLLPIPYGENGSLSSDGEWLAYIPYGTDQRTWKRYRGGMASDIWLFHLPTKTSKRMTDFEGTDSYPMWHGKTVYYLSDAGDTHRLNIWSYNTETGERQAITKYADYDCKSPAMGPGPNGEGEIIFQKGSQLLLAESVDSRRRTGQHHHSRRSTNAASAASERRGVCRQCFPVANRPTSGCSSARRCLDPASKERIAAKSNELQWQFRT
jgi:tricorn protease